MYMQMSMCMYSYIYTVFIVGSKSVHTPVTLRFVYGVTKGGAQGVPICAIGRGVQAIVVAVVS